MAVEIFGGDEGIVRLRDVICKQSRDEFGLAPISVAHRFGKPLAVNADLPREDAIGQQLGPAKLIESGLVFVRQSIKGEFSVAVQI